MKATKALKRLTHVEELLTDVIERYSDGTPDIRQQVLDAKAAVGRAKDALKSQVPSRAKSARKKAVTKKAAVKVRRAKTAKNQRRSPSDYEK